MKILVGMQDTPDSRAAYEHAVAECRTHDFELHMVVYVPMAVDSDTPNAYERKRAAVARDAETTARRLREEGVRVTAHAPVGAIKPSQAILLVARQEAVDLIVIGIRRRSRVGKLLTGSNAQDILLHAPVPVLAVKATYDFNVAGE